MVLKKIELTGFKSFAKKTELSFNAPVTAIVGPNGSGKSNVVEAIRFVLGEQSIKSLRGKGGADMIFKGSRALPALSRAAVTITFDNAKRRFVLPKTGEKELKLDFDEIAITREVYSDGSNKYSINGTEVRLKDILELVASVNIGSSGHHIISQGEADRLLSSNPKDRRGMIEDALGLRIYQYRLRESERKLEKTLINMKEVQALRREIVPHLTFLKKQVEKVEKAKELRTELAGLYQHYFATETGLLAQQKDTVAADKKQLVESLRVLDVALEKLQVVEGATIESPFRETIQKNETELNKLQSTRDELSRRLGRVEGSLESALQEHTREVTPSVRATPKVLPIDHVKNFLVEIRDRDTFLTDTDVNVLRARLESIRTKISHFISEIEGGAEELLRDPAVLLSINTRIESFRAEIETINTELAELERVEMALRTTVDELRVKEHAYRDSRMSDERKRYELIAERHDAEAKLERLQYEEETYKTRSEMYETEKHEAMILVGRDAFAKPTTTDTDTNDVRRKRIERIKIRLEDMGAAGGSDTLKEYEETLTRDQFLAHELDDLSLAIDQLRALITELKSTLDREFKSGVEKINTQFNEFFSTMFGGGSAFLSITVEHKRPSRDAEEDEIVVAEEKGDFEFERGIDIHVSLPQKKVKELSMLSGGERSLTSIALLFAMSQVNPPPFLVLDETDAALDEANSRRYGDMIETLSRYSQLIVVTHNRETMSRATVLYGVTIGADGGSKLLSIQFEEAVKIAK